jgi:hypothetical protein
MCANKGIENSLLEAECHELRNIESASCAVRHIPGLHCFSLFFGVISYVLSSTTCVHVLPHTYIAVGHLFCISLRLPVVMAMVVDFRTTYPSISSP